MFIVSEQQALELHRRCKEIEGDSAPLLYVEIESIVNIAATSNQLQEKDVKRLYELLNCVVISNYSAEDNKTSNGDEWDGRPYPKSIDEDSEVKGKIDKRNHILLSNKTVTRSIVSFRRCIGLIENQGRIKTRYQDHF